MSASLLDRDATGGAVARTGFEYQDAYVLQHLPMWLSQSAFSHIVSESKGDVEVCYFCPDFGIRRRAYEAKDYPLTESQFWSELTDFKAMFDASPNEFVEFVLVCSDFKSPVMPLLNKLERLRGVGASYPAHSPVLAETRTQIVDWITAQGQSAELANFIIERVAFVRFGAEAADASFGGMIEAHLPTLDLSSKRVSALREKCKALVARSAYGPIQRIDIEKALVAVLEDASEWTKTPTEIYLESRKERIEELQLNIGPFVGPDRENRTATEWAALLDSAELLAKFIASSRERRIIGLDGKQRMSLACMLGYVFSATRGFSLAIRHNEMVYRTDDHSKSEIKFFNDAVIEEGAAGHAGLACIGFPTPIGNDHRGNDNSTLGEIPSISLCSNAAIDSLSTLNTAIAEAKATLVKFRSNRNIGELHLFVKAPSFFSMALGHRLNGIGKVILYDWINGQYVQTLLLCEG